MKPIQYGKRLVLSNEPKAKELIIRIATEFCPGSFLIESNTVTFANFVIKLSESNLPECICEETNSGFRFCRLLKGGTPNRVDFDNPVLIIPKP